MTSNSTQWLETVTKKRKLRDNAIQHFIEKHGIATEVRHSHSPIKVQVDKD